jgi:hypothetical protein
MPEKHDCATNMVLGAIEDRRDVESVIETNQSKAAASAQSKQLLAQIA